jgi:hypothetical protein
VRRWPRHGAVGARWEVGSGSRREDYDMALHTDEGPGDGLVHAALYGYLAGHVQETRRGRPARRCGRYSMPAVMPAPHPWRQSRHHSTSPCCEYTPAWHTIRVCTNYIYSFIHSVPIHHPSSCLTVQPGFKQPPCYPFPVSTTCFVTPLHAGAAASQRRRA